jgi:hypothetical protein
VFIVEHYFQMQSFEAVELDYQVHLPDAAVPNKSTNYRLVNRFRETGSINEKVSRVELRVL